MNIILTVNKEDGGDMTIYTISILLYQDKGEPNGEVLKAFEAATAMSTEELIGELI